MQAAKRNNLREVKEFVKLWTNKKLRMKAQKEFELVRNLTSDFQFPCSRSSKLIGIKPKDTDMMGEESLRKAKATHRNTCEEEKRVTRSQTTSMRARIRSRNKKREVKVNRKLLLRNYE